MDSLVERLKNTAHGDHARGCHGRFYHCSCGFDERAWDAADEAATRIAEQDRLLKLARELIAAVDQMVEDTAPIFAEMEIARGCPYQGRQIGPELEALRQALAAMEQSDADR